jgi:hypothetical protein
VDAVTSAVAIGDDETGSATPRAGINLLVGRDEELATLRAAFDAAEGRPTIVLVIVLPTPPLLDRPSTTSRKEER